MLRLLLLSLWGIFASFHANATVAIH